MRLNNSNRTHLAEMMDVSLETNLVLNWECCWSMARWTAAMNFNSFGVKSVFDNPRKHARIVQ